MTATSKANSQIAPGDWKLVRVDEVFDIQQGKQVSKKNNIGKNRWPFLRTKNIMWGKLDLSEVDEMVFSAEDEKRLKLRSGDLLLCEGGSVGRTAIWNCQIDRCYYQNHLHRLRPSNGSILSHFALFWFWYAFEYSHVYLGRKNVTTIPNMSKSRLGELPLPCPKIEEQRRIAAILSTVRRAIELQEQLTARTTELKKALMHKLFTDGTRGEPRKMTAIGPVPVSWEGTSLGELCQKPNGVIQTGPFGSMLHKDDYIPSGIPVVNPIHLDNGTINTLGIPCISKDTAERLNRYRLKTNDLLFARRGEIGRHSIVSDNEENWLCGTGCFVVRISSPEVQPLFLNLYFSHNPVLNWLKRHAAGLIMLNLSNSVLSRTPIFLPDIKEQKRIIDVINPLTKKIQNHQNTREKLKDLFRALLNQLMTAQIRVRDVDLSELGLTAGKEAVR